MRGTDRKDGSGMNYHRYLYAYVQAHANLFPIRERWELHVHVDDLTMKSEYGKPLLRMKERHLIELKTMGDAILTRSMLWRMVPVFSPDVHVVFCRDIDCIPMPRDRAVCDTFIASNCAVSAAQDAPAHSGVMGGMSGFAASAFRTVTGFNSLDDLYTFATKSEQEWAQHGTDQLVLNRLVDSRPKLTLLEHRYAGWHCGPNAKTPHSRGEYRCKSWSTPTPDVGKSTLPFELREQADRLANHLGAAGYDHLAGREFWAKHGDLEITKAVGECER